MYPIGSEIGVILGSNVDNLVGKIDNRSGSAKLASDVKASIPQLLASLSVKAISARW